MISRAHAGTDAIQLTQYLSLSLSLSLALSLSLSLSLHFNGHFPGELGLAGVHWSKG